MHSRHLIGLVLLLGTSVAMPMDLLKASGRPDELPSSLATACGLVLNLLGFRIPAWLEPGVGRIGAASLALGLMAAGALIPLIGYRPTGGLFVLAGLVLTLAIAAVWRAELVARGALANAH